MINDNCIPLWIFKLTVVAMALCGYLFGMYIESSIWEKWAIEHGAGRYDHVTGDFQWVSDYIIIEEDD